MIIDMSHNYVRTYNNTHINIIEIGSGEDGQPSISMSDKKAAVGLDGIKGIAIGHDAYVNRPNGIVLGNYGKVDNNHGIAMGSYYGYVERYGETRRTFYDNTDNYARGWWEWYRDVPARELGAESLWFSLFLHGVGGEKAKLVPHSCIVFNIKLIGTDMNTSQNISAYHISGAIKRDELLESTAIVGMPIIDRWENVPLNVQVTADTILGALDLQVQQHDTNNFRFIASGWFTELRF